MQELACSYTDTVADCIALASYPDTQQQAVLLIGEPGCGKTSMGRAIAEAIGAELHITHPARQNPINYTGFPSKTADGDMMTWAEPELLHKLSTGRNVLVIDEIGQCGNTMQSTMGGLMLDRCVNSVRVSDETFIIATSNGVEHGAGSRSILTHTADRAMIRYVDYQYPDFETYFYSRDNLDVYALAFLKRMPQYLKDFSPDRTINASPRSWEMAAKLNPALPYAQMSRLLKGYLPAGIVLPYMEFRQVADRLPSIDEVLANPTTTPVPDEIDTRYVSVASLSTVTVQRARVAVFETAMQYIGRFPPELQTMFVHAVMSKLPIIKDSSVYTKWQITMAQSRGSH